MKLIYCLMILLWPLGNNCQKIKPLTIGDPVPAITLDNVINYKSTCIQLSALRGKLVILDFWATWCNGCVVELPKLDSLQKEFRGKMQVILLSNEGAKSNAAGESAVRAFYAKWQKRTHNTFSLPSTLDQNEYLLQLFSHIFIPHVIWIGPDQKVIAITSAEEVTKENIKAVLKGTPCNMAEKSDRLPTQNQN